MVQVRLSGPAQADLDRILQRSLDVFGESARDRLEELLKAGLQLIADDPWRGRRRDDISRDLLTFHLSLARRSARKRGATVTHPRHLFVYHVPNTDVVEILRVLHDAMDLAQHLPGGA
ncbi:MAG: type II toxin-antitoxin system RelE/ParE family toxin [Alphaproteobacteria bacterium]|nr:type II toxin-antitoxin system RelE/ParE family toxin [Alphaproteobacteria bacterium]